MFDSLTSAALADQLTSDALNGRVQAVGLVSRRAIWLEVYANRRRRYLVASAENQSPSVYLTETEPVSDRQLVTPLLLLLRKYVRGSRLVAVQQPPLERHITLTFASRMTRPEDHDVDESEDDENESDANVTFTHLHLEIMGRHSNLILVDDDDLIMESAKRVSLAMSRVRPIAPRRPYAPPPARDSADPRRALESEMAPVVRGINHEKELVRALTGHFRGVSPQVAREVIFRSRSEQGEVDPASVSRETRHLFEPLLTGVWQPVVYRNEEDLVEAYSPIPLTTLQDKFREESVDTISVAIELFDGWTIPATESGKHAVRSQRLTAAIRDALDRVEARAVSLESEVTRHQDRDRYRVWGETIFGYMWQIEPGDTVLEVDGIQIPLDPLKTPSEQARDYLERYNVAKSSDAQIAHAQDEVAARREYLSQLLTLASQARSIQDIEELEAEWFATQPEQSRGKAPKRSTGRKRTVPAIVIEDQPIYIGHSGAENDRVTFDVGGPDDTWLHARGVPGSHVIVKWTTGVRERDSVLLRAAELAAFFSQSRLGGRVEVDITDRKHVRKIKGGGPGMVTYRNERTVSVAPKGLD